MKKTVYTFWQANGRTPAYLDLCKQTWYANIPDLEVITIDHSNWAEYVGDIYDLDKLKGFSLPMQSDAVSAAVLSTRGGIFIDMDSIVTKDIFEDFVTLAPKKLVAFGKPNTKGMHIAVLKSTTPNNPITTAWMNEAKRRISNRAESFNWAYMGNDILHPLLNDKKYYDNYLLLDRADYGNILEAAMMKEGDPQADYFNLFFNEYMNINASDAVSAAKYGVISLHNSWTPADYKELDSAEEVYARNCLLSRLLKHVLEPS